MKPSRDISRLIEIMAALRTPGTGCPWDLEQNFATIAPYTLEEALQWIARVKPKRAILTNLHSDMDYATLRQELPDNVEPAFDGMSLQVD